MVVTKVLREHFCWESCFVVGQIDVKEARKMVESHPQWDFQDDDDEEEKKDDDADSESNVSSDDEMSDDYWTACEWHWLVSRRWLGFVPHAAIVTCRNGGEKV